MFELLVLIIFIWLLINSIKMVFKLTWGIAKVIAGILMVIALPVLVICLVFAGGIVLLAPLAVIGIAFGILKACV